MEKQRSKTVTKSCRRLLILCLVNLLISANAFTQTLTANEINQLRIRPAEGQNLFTKTDIKFEVLIPKAKPSQIQLLSSQLPSDVSFKTSRKQEDYVEGGTKIELWYSFEKNGNYQLSLPVIIQNRRRTIKFAQIKVEDDPSKQSPRIVLIFSNGSRVSSSDELRNKPLFNSQVGQKLSFTVFLQYSAQLVQFSWDLPKDSIFTQTKQYEITEVKYREKNYTHDLIPVANFEWTALKSGIQTIPKIKISATAYNGYRNELLLPETSINFTEGKQVNSSAADQMFDAAFKASDTITNLENSFEITDECCEHLAELYAEERNSVFKVLSKRRERMEYEDSLGLPSTTKGDFATGLIHIIGLAILFLIAADVIAIRKKHTLRILIITILLSCTFVPFISQLIIRNKLYGISKGSQICSVPEEKAEAISEIGAGNRVRITEQAGKWYYIEFGENGGWCLKDSVILIK